MAISNWYKIKDPDNVISPALLIYPDRIEKNIHQMILIAGGTEYLRPHIKTHKIAEIIALQMKCGVFKFKCATIAEAELLARCEAKDILIAIQPVKKNIERFFTLIEKYPKSKFSTIVDNKDTINEISNIALKKKIDAYLWLDINNGMNRTGVLPNKKAIDLYQYMQIKANIITEGIHVYDGHIKQADFELRKKKCDEAFVSILDLKNQLIKLGIDKLKIIAGGSPTFPIHARRKHVEVSPGTTLLWDEGYGSTYKDLKFIPAAVLLTRVVSKPNVELICLDLGHKFVASENNLPRVKFFEMENSRQINHHEEHLVIHYNKDKNIKVGDIFYGIPYHICPTVAKYKNVITILNGKVTGNWKVVARNQKLSI